MLILADNRIPDVAKKKLSEYGEVIPFSTEGITYESISGHPDIFFCQVENQLIVAPNLPDLYKNILHKNSIPFIEGEMPVEKKYPGTSLYNIVASDEYLIHNFRYTDSVITDIGEHLDLIHSGQGYTRCNLLPLRKNCFITSDQGIKRVLNGFQLNTFYVDPEGILLPGMKHGFFGGACGVFEDKVFIIGSLSGLKNGKELKTYIHNLDYQIIELYDGPVFDGGSIFFIK
jgi:hypothetical protein